MQSISDYFGGTKLLGKAAYFLISFFKFLLEMLQLFTLNLAFKKLSFSTRN